MDLSTLYERPRLRDLLAAVLAGPEEDGPRLAWADALAEEGDGCKAAQERADFVRVQIRLAELERDPHGGRFLEWPNLRERQGSLLKAHAGPWVGLSLGPQEVLALPGSAVGVYLNPQRVRLSFFEFRRGFVDRVRCTGDDWLARGEAVRGVEPVREVELSQWPTAEGAEGLAILRRLDPNWEGEDVVMNVDDPVVVRRALKKQWPRISFRLPNEG
jgi:uncharacterized protein (TIGR02996 family)